MSRFLTALLTCALAMPAIGQRRRSAHSVDRHPPNAWTTPACDTVHGLPSVRFTLSDARLSENALAPAVNTYASDVVVSDVANRLYAIFEDFIYRTDDAGCRWVRIAAGAREFRRLVVGPDGTAYAWSFSGEKIIRVRAAAVSVLSLPEAVAGLGVDPADASHLWAVAKMRGTTYESFDGGATWRVTGYPGIERAVNAVSFDPSDSSHIVLGADGEIAQTLDGGATWKRTSVNTRVFEIALSPADTDVIWLSGIFLPTLQEMIIRSEDGGASFSTVFVHPLEARFNRSRLAPHPTDSRRVAFASWEGLAIGDAATRTVRMLPSPKRFEAIVWAPTGETVYVSAADVSVIVN